VAEPVPELVAELEPVAELAAELEPVAELELVAEPVPELVAELEPVAELEVVLELMAEPVTAPDHEHGLWPPPCYVKTQHHPSVCRLLNQGGASVAGKHHDR